MKDSRQVVLLNLDDILPNRFQPRIKFDEQAIVELSESIKEHGVIQPIIVRRISDKFEIIAGERRYKASVMAGKTSIPAIIVDLNDKDSSEIALIENVQRQDLTPIEEAISYRKILDMGYLTQEALATKLGVAQSTIANKLRLLNLDDDVQEALLDGKISERHARSLLRLEKTSMQKEMLKRIISERLTVRKTDEEINNMMKNNDISILDSIENNNMDAFENVASTDENKNENPFIINSEVTTPPVDTNVEVLDFGFEEIKPDIEVRELDNDLNNEIEEIKETNIPSNPIVEDAEVPEVQQPTNNVQIEPAMEQNNQIQEQVSENSAEVESSAPTGGRFFTMFARPVEEEKPAEKVNDEVSISAPENQVDNTNIFSEQPAPSQAPIIPEEPAIQSQPIEPEVATNIFNQTIAPEPVEEYYVEEETNELNNSVPESLPVQEDVNIGEENVEPVIVAPQEQTGATLRDIINKMRKCADEIETMGFDIDTEEFDFDDIYQVIFKIKK